MKESDVFSSNARSLARLLDFEESGKGPWMPEEFAAILAHQLAAPLEADLLPVDPGAGRLLSGLRATSAAPLATFQDLLRHAHPPVELLQLTRTFAKQCRKGPESPMPVEVSTVLYLAAIVAARTKCHVRISRLDDHSLRESLQWALAQAWLDGETRSLLLEGSTALARADEASS